MTRACNVKPERGVVMHVKEIHVCGSGMANMSIYTSRAIIIVTSWDLYENVHVAPAVREEYAGCFD